MKFFLIPLLFLFSFIQTGKKNYQSPEGDYCMDISESTEINRTKLKNTNMAFDQFIFHDKGETAKSYAITIAIAKGLGGDNEIKLSNDFVGGYLNTCNCELLERKKVKFKHFSGTQLKTKILQPAGVILQYNIQFLKNGVSYMITFISSESNFMKYEPFFLESVNSFIPLH
jgi:hypothetical protein